MQLLSKFVIALVFTVTCYSHVSAQPTTKQESNFQQNRRGLQGPSLRKNPDTFRTQKKEAELTLDTNAEERLALPAADEVASNRGKLGNKTATAVWWVLLPMILSASASWGCLYLISEGLGEEEDVFVSEEESRQQRTRQPGRNQRLTKAIEDSQQILSEEETLLNEVNEMQEIASNATKPTGLPANTKTVKTKQHT